MGELWFARALEFGNDPLRQGLAELDAPLVKGIDLPEGALCEDAVLVKRDQLAKRGRRQAFKEKRIRRTIAFENAMGHEPVRRAFRFHVRGCFTEGKRLGLSKDVGEQHIVMPAE